MGFLFRMYGKWALVKAQINIAAMTRGLPSYKQSPKNFRFVIQTSFPPSAEVQYLDGAQVTSLGVFPR